MTGDTVVFTRRPSTRTATRNEPNDAPAVLPTPAIRRTVVGIDFADSSCVAAQWATQYLIGDSELVLAYVIPQLAPSPLFRASIPTAGELVETMRRGAELRLRGFSTTLASRRVWTEVRVGQAAKEIAAIATDFAADLIALGDRGARVGAGRYVGHTAERVMRDSNVPVLVGRNLPHGPVRRLLVAVDEGPEMPNVVAWTQRLATHFSAEVVAVHVVTPSVSAGAQIMAAGAGTNRARESVKRSVTQWLDGQITPLVENGTSVTAVVEFGEAGTELLAAADRFGAELIVIGRGGAGRPLATFLGGVTNHVIRAARRSVLVVP